MYISKSIKSAIVAGAFGLVGAVAPAYATLETISLGVAAGALGVSGPYATVTLNDFGSTGTVHVTITPNSGFSIIDTGAGDPLLFNLVNNPTLVLGASGSIRNLTSGFGLEQPTGNQDGTGSWMYGITCSICGNGGSGGGFTGTMSFDLVLAGVTTASFISTSDSNGYRFATDICVLSSSGTSCSATGDAANGSSSSSSSSTSGGGGGSGNVPEPSSSALALLGVALLGFTMLKRKLSHRA